MSKLALLAPQPAPGSGDLLYLERPGSSNVPYQVDYDDIVSVPTFGDGTEAAPTIAFGSEATGFFLEAAANIALSVVGTKILEWTADETIYAQTGAITVPIGTTGERPTPVNGMFRYNSTVPQLEAYIDGSWTALSGGGGGGLNNVVEDTTPQLGGMLDVNTFSLGDGTRKLLDFVEDGSAVNYIEIENEATGSGPVIRPAGTDPNIDLNLQSKSSGLVKINGVEAVDLSSAQTLTNKAVAVARIGGSTYSTLQHMQDTFHSAGWFSGGGITDDADGTITVAAGTGAIRATDSAVAQIVFMDWAAEAGANVNLADNDISYIYVEYNGGSPQAIATTTLRTDFNTNVLLAIVGREGTDLHINEADLHIVGDHANAMIRRAKAIMPFAHASGGIISETGTQNFAFTAGVFWQGLTEFPTAALDTAVADDFSYFYRDSPSGWIEQTAETDINNTQYDDGDGALGTLSNNLYGVHWVYLSTDDHVFVLFGQGNYTLSQAQDADAPATVPQSVEVHGFLAGKIIIQKSATSFTTVESAFEVQFTGGAPTDHGGLAGLGDNDHPHYELVATGRSKSITVETPTSSEDISMFFTNAAITITEMRAVVRGSTPSLTWTVKHGTDRSAAGAAVVTAGTTTTSESTGSDVTAFDDATIVADSFVWLESTAESGTTNEFHLTIVYTID